MGFLSGVADFRNALHDVYRFNFLRMDEGTKEIDLQVYNLHKNTYLPVSISLLYYIKNIHKNTVGG